MRLSSYSKLLLASQDQVLGLLTEEKTALQAQLKQEQDDPQACFIQSALLQLQVTHKHTPQFRTSRPSFSTQCTHLRVLACLGAEGQPAEAERSG